MENRCEYAENASVSGSPYVVGVPEGGWSIEIIMFDQMHGTGGVLYAV